ncbi:MAG: hypothetical protein IKM81_12420 [Fibrobacter sp.]|nr:hypothetical protein [Fibrobacter sp.]
MKKVCIIFSILIVLMIVGTVVYKKIGNEILMTDPRDGKSYRTVVIGEQTWMAENLNFDSPDSYCYNKTQDSCAKYGRLYTWAAAMDSAGIFSKNGAGCGYGKTCNPAYPVQGVCPSGWHLPTKNEFAALFLATGLKFKKKIKEGEMFTGGSVLMSTKGWYKNSRSGVDGTDLYGFSALPAGFRNRGGLYDEVLIYTNFWNSTEMDNVSADNMYVGYADVAGLYHSFSKYSALSVRCVKNGKTPKLISTSDFSKATKNSLPKANEDNANEEKLNVDMSKYTTVQIGNRLWMAENMNEPTEGSYCYDNDESKCRKYGRLYTWEAAQKVCPSGWHLPNLDDEKSLMRAVGSSDREERGYKLAAKGEWDFRDGEAQDALGFSLLPAGRMYLNKDKLWKFDGLGYRAHVWLDAVYSEGFTESIELDNGGWSRGGGGVAYEAISVRCVKDYESSNVDASATVDHLNGGFVDPSAVSRQTFQDPRDKYIYKTVTIGVQTWFAENLQYKIGDSYCASGEDSDCSSLGRTYDWMDAMEACPQGWRLPSVKEVRDLIKAVGSSAAKIKSVSGWEKNGGTDDYGLSIRPENGKVTYIWTSSKIGDASAQYFAVSFGHDRIITSKSVKTHMHVVRCVKN